MIELGSQYCIVYDYLLFVVLHIRGFRVQGSKVLVLVVRLFMEGVTVLTGVRR